MWARTAASFAFACAESALSAAPAAVAQHTAMSAAAMHGRLMRRGIAAKHTRLVGAAILPRPKIPTVVGMQRLFEFIGNHALLAAAAAAAALAAITYEIRERLKASAALSAMQAVRLMNQGALVIDVRTKEAFD